MSATPLPDDQSQIPDAVSADALRTALGRALPQATTLPNFGFGRSHKHEGVNDFVFLLTMICAQEHAPSSIQLINALAYMADILHAQMRETTATQSEVLTQQIEEHASTNPVRSQAAKNALLAMQDDMAELLERAAAAAQALSWLRKNALEAQLIVESLNLQGADTPRPDKRRRFISDEFLASIGMDREAFEAYFERRIRG